MTMISLLSPSLISAATPSEWLSRAATVVLAYALLRCIYNFHFHPAARFPGPRYAAVSNFWQAYHRLQGRWPWVVEEMLKKHGAPVRIGPNEVVFSTPQAAIDIYNSAVRSQEIWLKTDLMDFGTGDGGYTWQQDPAKRREIAKKILPAFTTKATKAKEPVVQMYIDTFVDKMKEHGSVPDGIEIGKWILWLAVDMSADLAYGREMSHMRDKKNTEFLDTMVGTSFFATVTQVSKNFPLLRPFTFLVVPPRILRLIPRFIKMNSQEIQRRIDNRTQTKHANFVDYLLPAEAPAPTTKKQKVHIEQIALQLFAAGFDPIQLTFYGCLFLLLKEPNALATLVDEIRTSFQYYDDITPDSLAGLKYLNACINETLRVQNPNTTGMRRLSPGATVDGIYVPKGVICHVSLFSIGRSSHYFYDPLRFRPERWLSHGDARYDVKFANDQLKSFYPFALGPRACVGREIAWSQTRLFLAKVLWTFNLEMVRGHEAAFDKDFRVFLMWEKPEIWVRFVAR